MTKARRTTTSKRSRGPHKYLRHRRVLPDVPRADREQAVAAIMLRFGDHGAPLLMLARHTAAAAFKMDRALRLIDWLFELRDAIADLPWPPELDEGTTLTVGSSTLDLNALAQTAREGMGLMQALARCSEDFKIFPRMVEQSERLRDLDTLMGASVVRFASEHGIQITHRDLAELAIAIGIDSRGDDYRTSWDRWYKRMPRIRRTASKAGNSLSESTPFDEATFYQPFAVSRNEK